MAPRTGTNGSRGTSTGGSSSSSSSSGSSSSSSIFSSTVTTTGGASEAEEKGTLGHTPLQRITPESSSTPRLRLPPSTRDTSHARPQPSTRATGTTRPSPSNSCAGDTSQQARPTRQPVHRNQQTLVPTDPTSTRAPPSRPSSVESTSLVRASDHIHLASSHRKAQFNSNQRTSTTDDSGSTAASARPPGECCDLSQWQQQAVQFAQTTLLVRGMTNVSSKDDNEFEFKATELKQLRSMPAYIVDRTITDNFWAAAVRRKMNKQLARELQDVRHIPEPPNVMDWRRLITAIPWSLSAHANNATLPAADNPLNVAAMERVHIECARRSQQCRCGSISNATHIFDDGTALHCDPQCEAFLLLLNLSLGWLALPPDAELPATWHNRNNQSVNEWSRFGEASFEKAVAGGWLVQVAEPGTRIDAWSLAVRANDKRKLRDGLAETVVPRACTDARIENAAIPVPAMRFTDTNNFIIKVAKAEAKAGEPLLFEVFDFSSFYPSLPLSRTSREQIGTMHIPYGQHRGYWRHKQLFFGLSSAPILACSVSAFVVDAFRSQAIATVDGLSDDLLVTRIHIDDVMIGAPPQVFQQVVSVYTTIVADFGLTINAAKRVQPTRNPTYCGIHYNFEEGRLSLKNAQWAEYAADITALLEKSSNTDGVTKQDVRAVQGVRNWCANVLPAARLRHRSGWRFLKTFRWKRRAKLSKEYIEDLKWERQLYLNPKRPPERIIRGVHPSEQWHLWCDAGDEGAAALLVHPNGHGGHVRVRRMKWKRKQLRTLRNLGASSLAKEAMGLADAVTAWTKCRSSPSAIPRGAVIVIHLDNAGLVFALNSGSAKTRAVVLALRRIVNCFIAKRVTHTCVWRRRDTPGIDFVDRCGRTFRANEPNAFRPAMVANTRRRSKHPVENEGVVAQTTPAEGPRSSMEGHRQQNAHQQEQPQPASAASQIAAAAASGVTGPAEIARELQQAGGTLRSSDDRMGTRSMGRVTNVPAASQPVCSPLVRSRADAEQARTLRHAGTARRSAVDRGRIREQNRPRRDLQDDIQGSHVSERARALRQTEETGASDRQLTGREGIRSQHVRQQRSSTASATGRADDAKRTSSGRHHQRRQRISAEDWRHSLRTSTHGNSRHAAQVRTAQSIRRPVRALDDEGVEISPGSDAAVLYTSAGNQRAVTREERHPQPGQEPLYLPTTAQWIANRTGHDKERHPEKPSGPVPERRLRDRVVTDNTLATTDNDESPVSEGLSTQRNQDNFKTCDRRSSRHVRGGHARHNSAQGNNGGIHGSVTTNGEGAQMANGGTTPTNLVGSCCKPPRYPFTMGQDLVHEVA